VYTVHSTTYEGVHQALFLCYDCFLNSLQDVTANAVARNLSLSSNFIGGKRPVLLAISTNMTQIGNQSLLTAQVTAISLPNSRFNREEFR